MKPTVLSSTSLLLYSVVCVDKQQEQFDLTGPQLEWNILKIELHASKLW